MIFHKGPSTSTGHYTSMISGNNMWYLCNDTNVTVVDFNKSYMFEYSLHTFFFLQKTNIVRNTINRAGSNGHRLLSE